jgi:SPP1 gp7 family putative phage head morphogenesis protein
MPLVNGDMLDASIGRQITIERLKNNNKKDIALELSKLDKKLVVLLSGIDDISLLNRSKLNKLISTVSSEVDKYSKSVLNLIYSTTSDFMPLESAFQASLLNEVIKSDDYTAFKVSSSLLLSKYANSFINEGNGKATTVKKAESKLVSSNSSKVTQALNNAFLNTVATNELLKAVRGTKQNKFRDGVLFSLSNTSNTLSDSLIQHSSVIAKVETGKRNGIKKYTWLATIDGRTSTQCRSLDELETIYVFGEGPLPPLHYNCRSTIIYIIDGRLSQTEGDGSRTARNSEGKTVMIDSNIGYYEWLKSRPINVQERVLGKTKTNLFNNGGLTEKEFAKLSIGKNYAPLTIKEMEKRNSAAFELAGITI